MPLVRKCCRIKATDTERSDSLLCTFPSPIVGVPHQFNMDELQESVLKGYVVRKGRLQGQDQIHMSFHFKDDNFATSEL